MSRNPDGEFRGFDRSVDQVSALVLVIVVLHFLVFRGDIASPFLFLAAVGVYGALLLAIRLTGVLRRVPKTRIFIASAAMIALTTVSVALGGESAESLRYILLLPVVASALTLQGTATLLVLALVVVARVLLGLAGNEFEVPAAEWVVVLVAELVPALLIAMLAWEVASSMRRARERMRMLADTDDLTGLSNMRAFRRVVSAERNRLAPRNGQFAILMIDIDGLKSINDEFGHDEGNRALQTVADVLGRSVRGGDLAARYAGDEFVAYLVGTDESAARTVANRIRHNVFATTQALGHDMRRLTVSVGVAVYPDDGADTETLLGKADKSMYEDKAMRRLDDEMSMDTAPGG